MVFDVLRAGKIHMAMQPSQADLEQLIAAQESARRPRGISTVRPNLINPYASDYEMAYGALSIAGVDNFDIIGSLSMPVHANAHLEGEKKNAWKDYLVWRLNLSKKQQEALDALIIKKGATAYQKVFEKVFGKTEAEAKYLVKSSAYELMVKGWESFAKLKIFPNYSVSEGLEATVENAELIAARTSLLISIYQLITGKKEAGINAYTRFISDEIDEEDILSVPYQENLVRDEESTPLEAEDSLETIIDETNEPQEQNGGDEATPYQQDENPEEGTNIDDTVENGEENQPVANVVHNVRIPSVTPNHVPHVESAEIEMQHPVQRHWDENNHQWVEGAQ